MSAKELARLIGKVAAMNVRGELFLYVRITDARLRFGTVDVFVEPLAEAAGTGGTWVTRDSVSLFEGN